MLENKNNFSQLLRISFLLMLVTVLVSGCLNNSSPSTSSAISRTLSAILPGVGTTNPITLSRALRSNVDPSNMLELISSGTDIGTYCKTATDCSCRFTFIESDGTLRNLEVVPERVESNLMRCKFSGITAGITSFGAAVLIIAGNQTSNTITVTMPVSNPTVDPSLNSNYLQARRYMCRDMIPKTANTNFYMNNSLFDPRLWNLSLPYSFYTTSLGSDYGAVAERDASGALVSIPTNYECPLIPNDASENSIYDINIYSEAAVDVTNPGNTNPVFGDATIYPVDSDVGLTNCLTGKESTCEKYALNRHDFYVATFKSAVFKEPFCVRHKVTNVVTANGVLPALDCTVDESKGAAILGSAALGKDVIGFAAVPDANENCPSSVTLPSGKKWAKVWRYRTSYELRYIQDVTNPDAIGSLFCTTRKAECKPGSATDNGVFNDGVNTRTYSNCFDMNGDGPRFGAVEVPPVGTPTGDRYGNCSTNGLVGDGRALAPTPYRDVTDTCSLHDCCRDVGGLASTIFGTSDRAANFTSGGNFCNPTLVGTPAPSGGTDGWIMGIGGWNVCIESDTDANGKLALAFPPSSTNPYKLAQRQLDQSNRDDILLVVTPKEVKQADLEDVENKVIAKQYRPRRKKPNSSGWQVYSLAAKSGNSADPNDRTSKFPLCILQDDKAGQ